MVWALASKLFRSPYSADPGMSALAFATGSAQLVARCAYGLPMPLGAPQDAWGLVSRAMHDLHSLSKEPSVAALPFFTPGHPLRRLLDWRITVAEVAAQQMLHGDSEDVAMAVDTVARVAPVLEGLRRLALVREMLKEFRMPEDSPLPWWVSKERFENTRDATGLNDELLYRGGIVEVAPEQFEGLRRLQRSYWRSGEKAFPRLSLSLQNYFCGAQDVALTKDEQITVRRLSNQYLDVVLSPYMGVSALGHLPRYYGALPAPSPTVRLDFWRHEFHPEVGSIRPLLAPQWWSPLRGLWYEHEENPPPQAQSIHEKSWWHRWRMAYFPKTVAEISDHQAVRWSRQLVIAIERAKDWDQLILVLKNKADHILADNWTKGIATARKSMNTQIARSRAEVLDVLRCVTPHVGIRRRVASFPPFADHEIQPWELARMDDEAICPDVVAEAVRIWEGKPAEPAPPPAPIEVKGPPPEPPAAPVEDRAPARQQLLSLLRQRLDVATSAQHDFVTLLRNRLAERSAADATYVPTFRRDASPTEPSSASPSPASLVGQTILGRYRVERRAHENEGSQGDLYWGTDSHLEDRPVALKVVHLREGTDPHDMAAIRSEARVLAALRNPHIVVPSDFGTLPDGSLVLVMERVEGTTLSTLLAQSGRLPPGRVYPLIEQLLIALSAAHKKGIRHHDLKPDNIIVDRLPDGSDHLTLLDFGISRIAEDGPSIDGKRPIIGTPHYMAPERIRQDGAIDERSDLYAVGVIIYQLLSGRRPFIGRKPIDIVRQHLEAEVPPIDDWPKAWPYSLYLIALMSRLLKKDKTLRPESALACLEQLRDAQREDARVIGSEKTRRLAPLGTVSDDDTADVADHVPVPEPRGHSPKGFTDDARAFIEAHRLDRATCLADLSKFFGDTHPSITFRKEDIEAYRRDRLKKALNTRIPASLRISRDQVINMIFRLFQTGQSSEAMERWWQLDGKPDITGRGIGFPASFLRLIDDQLNARELLVQYPEGVAERDWAAFETDVWVRAQRAREMERYLQPRAYLYPGFDAMAFRTATETQVSRIYDALPPDVRAIFWKLEGTDPSLPLTSYPGTFLVWTFRCWQQALAQRTHFAGLMETIAADDGVGLRRRISHQLLAIAQRIAALHTRLRPNGTEADALRALLAAQQRLVEIQVRELYPALPELGDMTKKEGGQALAILQREVRDQMTQRERILTAEMRALPGAATREEIAAAIQKMQRSDVVTHRLAGIAPHLREPPAEADIDYLKLLQAMHP